jgi:hypothetical protein
MYLLIVHPGKYAPSYLPYEVQCLFTFSHLNISAFEQLGSFANEDFSLVLH